MTTTLTPATAAFPSPDTATLADIFRAYQLSYIEVEDEPGNGAEFNAYNSTDAWVSLPFDEDEDDCIAGYSWDTYLPLILDELSSKVGRYHRVEGRLTQMPDGTFFFKGNITTEFEG